MVYNCVYLCRHNKHMHYTFKNLCDTRNIHTLTLHGIWYGANRIYTNMHIHLPRNSSTTAHSTPGPLAMPTHNHGALARNPNSYSWLAPPALRCWSASCMARMPWSISRCICSIRSTPPSSCCNRLSVEPGACDPPPAWGAA